MQDTGWVSVTEFVRNPNMVGSAFPASARMVNRILDPIDWSTINLLIEYGPGSGRFTFEALRRMRPDARLMAIDTGEEFVAKLRSHCRDPRLIIVNGCAGGVNTYRHNHDLPLADCVLTGLPFSTLDDGEGEAIMRETAAALQPDGLLAAYQMRTTIRPLIERHFRQISHDFEWWNIPPCHVYRATGPVRESIRGWNTATAG
ncbi:methyltransferase domain-containing protein [Altererythrobacter xixiisoli]|uniref:Methyltransferase domain-containing protein n=1 Tax=Croceibacterium xixiisoli TaxID=1476466 RepID=A0A6I4TVF9_9SPHN|nr:methyltransferase domain-containing protein [Croceibacterium xixiisoli]MXO98578.1 methyltransferase domain-containing protein [Croceibacterium xixiisoli]